MKPELLGSVTEVKKTSIKILLIFVKMQTTENLSLVKRLPQWCVMWLKEQTAILFNL